MKNHVGVNLRAGVMAEVDELVESGWRGHTSRPGIIEEAIRKYADDAHKQMKNKQRA